MSNIGEIATVEVADHEITFYYDVDGLDPSLGPVASGSIRPLRLSDLVSPEAHLFPGEQLDALRARYADQPVWERQNARVVGTDFHDHIVGLLRGDRGDLITYWTLAQQAKRLVEKCDLYVETTVGARTRKRLVWSPGKAAVRRMSRHGIEGRQLEVELVDLTVASFSTGHGFCVARVSLTPIGGGPLCAIELLEAQNAFARFNRISWSEVAHATSQDVTEFSLGEFVRGLVLGPLSRTKKSGRVHTYVYARFDQPTSVQARDTLAVWLARQYTSDYDLDMPNSDVELIEYFGSVRHAIAIEGVATVVGRSEGDEEIPPFLENYKTGTYRPNYQQIALLALHEQAYLVAATAASLIPPADMGNEQALLTRLEELRQAALAFRLCFRFSELSYVSTQNAFHRAIRRAMRLDQMMVELGTDLADVDVYLKSARERAHKAAFDWLTWVGGSATAGAMVFSPSKDLFEALLGDDSSWPAFIALGACVLIGFFVSQLLRRKSDQDLISVAPLQMGGQNLAAIFRRMLEQVRKG